LQNGYFQHDGATAHTTQENLVYLQQFYGNRIISNRLNPEFPPRSPDLTPLDFCIFRHLKNEVFKKRMHTLEELMEEIRNCCNTIDQQISGGSSGVAEWAVPTQNQMTYFFLILFSFLNLSIIYLMICY
jgi:hypothetical protein